MDVGCVMCRTDNHRLEVNFRVPFVIGFRPVMEKNKLEKDCVFV